MADPVDDKQSKAPNESVLSGAFKGLGQKIYRALEWGHQYGVDVGIMIGSSAALAGIGAYLAVDWYQKQTDLPSRHDKRERMANQLMARGHATVDELLEASYGEWPPKGLDIIGKNRQRVNFVHLIGMIELDRKHPIDSLGKMYDELMKIAGRASLGGDRKIGMNPLTRHFLPRFSGKSNIASTLGHETAHILQGDHYYRAHEIFGQKNAGSLWKEIEKPMSDMIADAAFDEKYLKPGVTIDRTKSHDVGNKMAYLTRGVEVQARIHQIVADGYQQWKVLPVTRAELTAALVNMGLKPPKPVMDIMANSQPHREAAARFDIGPQRQSRNVRGAVSNLNYIQEKLTDEGKAYFWKVALLAIYGDLIEMYGDRYGNERFLPTVNRYRIFREAQLEAEKDNARKPWSLGGMREDMRILPPRAPEESLVVSLARNLFNRAVSPLLSAKGATASRREPTVEKISQPEPTSI